MGQLISSSIASRIFLICRNSTSINGLACCDKIGRAGIYGNGSGSSPALKRVHHGSSGLRSLGKQYLLSTGESPAWKCLFRLAGSSSKLRIARIRGWVSTSYLPFPMHPSSTPQALDDAHEKMKMVSQFNSFPLFPPGWVFCPTDVELIVHYLRKKILNQKLPMNLIPEVQVYNHDPEYLTEKYPPCGEETWYFFTSGDQQHMNEIQPNRIAGNGYWKASGGDKPIWSNGYRIGDKMVLVFHKGRPSENDEKTNWIMHEFQLIQGSTNRGPNGMKLDDWVLCKVYKNDSRDDADILMGNRDHLDGFDDDGLDDDDDDTGPSNSLTNLNQQQ